MKSKQFEYMVKTNLEVTDLNKYGLQGWELTTTFLINNILYSYFKREIL